MGVANIRVFVRLFKVLWDFGVEELFGAGFRLCLNMLIGEVWTTPRAAAQLANQA